ncbi:hypothetical protein CDCA_CDCA04G1293 [Cyanidium caldarium]|uniref:Mitochondrial import inner membrane translocase subunit TIM16 n=1 Tax=Cyanidium caldarium TaxID=2771 RepID=A0AAV9IT58_CYACA|nr:hypothetical protein CDCA_CDCA04G1293 [Cyanidium caldarium]|eukprot:ctg_177.g75
MASKLLAQIIIIGGQYVIRGLAEAYRQALLNAQAGGPAAGAARQGAAAAARRGRMSLEEACKVLNVSPESAVETLRRQFQRLYEMNDPKRGGSLYLQAKVFNARRTLEEELKTSLEPPDTAERQTQ